jgi:hypothetical protein
MSGLPNTWAGNVIDYITGRVAPVYTAPRPVFMGLLTADAGGGDTLATISEVLDSGYARQPVSWNAPAATSSSPMTSGNTALLTFGPFPSGMATAATYAFLTNAQTGTVGDLIWVWPLDQPFQAAANGSEQIPANAATLFFQGV